jgi:hypothetical protein
MTPAELYDEFYCYTIIQGFPAKTLQKTMAEMNKAGTLIKKRGGRPIPSTNMSLSAKFMSIMAGELPAELLPQAKEYEKFLGTQDTKFRFNSVYVSSGMMACLLNLLSNKKVKKIEPILFIRLIYILVAFLDICKYTNL